MTQPETRPPRQSPAALGVTAARAIVAAQRFPLAARYGYPLAVALTAVGLGATALLQPFLGRTILILFWPVVLAVAVFAGLGPAVLASVLAVLAVDFFF